MMNEFHKTLLLRNRVRLVSDLQSETLINYMIQDGIMTPNDSEVLKSKLTTQYKNEYFLDLLATRGPNAFASFLKNLKESEEYPLYEFVNNLASQPSSNVGINQHCPGFAQQGAGYMPGDRSQPHTGRPHQVESPDCGSLSGSTNQFQPGSPHQVSSTTDDKQTSVANQHHAGHPQQESSLPASLVSNPPAKPIQQVSPDCADGPSFAGRQMPTSVPKENIAMQQLPITMFPERRVTEIDLNTFSGKMGPDWKSFIRSLGLKDNEIFHASSGCHTERDKIFSCLVKWRNREANKATVRALVEKCYENELDIEIFDFLCQ